MVGAMGVAPWVCVGPGEGVTPLAPAVAGSGGVLPAIPMPPVSSGWSQTMMLN